MIPATQKTTENFCYQLDAAQPEIILSTFVAGLGYLPTAKLELALEIPAQNKIALIDDLHLAGYGQVKLRFIVGAYADFSYCLRAVRGLADDAACDDITLSIERELDCILAGVGARAEMQCLYYGAKTSFLKIKTKQEHRAAHATSNVIVKSVLADAARISCHSMINVAPGANGTNAEQVNKNILLSRQARAVSVPMLEVLANDVKCKHGAAVSRLDDEQFFYLQSRGIDRAHAKNMLLEAFLTKA